ncbi:MAG: hypothetical protein ACE5Q6_02545 [Dehalococcoidia bacterium]
MSVDPATFELLQNREFVTCELTPFGSNYTFAACLRWEDRTCQAIYKPRDGEVPLWDFPRGTLYKRECAAYLLSEILGWDFIPLTIIRDGPYGIGSVQLYVDHDPSQNYYNLTEADADDLRLIASYDLVANNTDRKANHVLVDPRGKLWGIDQGLCFHADTKIRTCIWDFCGEPIPQTHLDSLVLLLDQLPRPQGRLQELLDLLLPEEIEALYQRVRWILSEKVYPGLPGRRRRRY